MDKSRSYTPDAVELRRCAVFTGGWSFNVRRHVGRLADAYPDIEWHVLVHGARQSPRQLAKSQIRNLRKHGWRWIPYRIGGLLDHLREALAPKQPTGPRPGSKYSDASIRSRTNVVVRHVPDINAVETAESLRQSPMDLGIAIAAPILRPRIFDLPRLGSLNIHRGKIPQYRGMPPGFWEIHDGETTVGCTVHRVVEQLDAGEVLLQEELPIPPHATVRGIQVALQEVGLKMIVEAVEIIRSGAVEWWTPSGLGQVRTRPALALEAAVDRRLRSGGAGALRRWRLRGRSLLLGLRNRLVGVPARVLRGLFGKQHAVVLLYHRVNDDMRDELTTGIEQFERHLEWLRQRCRIVSIEDVVNDDLPRHSLRPIVAITFDDGYLDNALYAAPLLEEHGFPAAFFVPTDFIGTARDLPHDLLRDRRGIPLMSWDHVRELKEAGFTIGSHTANHIDCAATPLDELRRDLHSSREALTRGLGDEAHLFAYPYGGREHMTGAALAVVQELGFAACLSAYGGSNAVIDPYDIRRKGIHHDFDVESLSGRIHGRG